MAMLLANLATLSIFIRILFLPTLIVLLVVAYILYRRRRKRQEAVISEAMDELDNIEREMRDYEAEHREPPKNNIINIQDRKP